MMINSSTIFLGLVSSLTYFLGNKYLTKPTPLQANIMQFQLVTLYDCLI